MKEALFPVMGVFRFSVSKDDLLNWMLVVMEPRY
jgi:hypothetical protein